MQRLFEGIIQLPYSFLAYCILTFCYTFKGMLNKLIDSIRSFRKSSFEILPALINLLD